MPETLELEIATPERQLVHEQVAEVTVPARNGYLGILPGHAPLLAELATGVLHYKAGGRRWLLAIHGGFLEVLPDHVRVLATAAEKTDEIDVERARRALQRAQQQAINPAVGVDPAAALEAIHRAEARLEAASRR